VGVCMRVSWWSLILVCLLAPAVCAEETELELNLETHLWVPFSFETDSETDGLPFPADLDFSNVDDFDGLGFWGGGSVYYGAFGAFVSGMYAEFDIETSVGPFLPPPLPNAGLRLGADFEFARGAVDFGGALRLRYLFEDKPKGPRFVAMFGVGARFQTVTQILELSLNFAGRQLNVRRGGTVYWFEPLLKLDLEYWAFSWLSLMVRNKLSGFALGEDSAISYDFVGGVELRPVSVFSVTLAYRLSLIDYSHKSASGKTAANSTYHGPYLGFGFHF
jgi:hypothetical protein